VAEVDRRVNDLPPWLLVAALVLGMLGSISGITGAVLGILNVMWRRRDRQSRVKIEHYLGDDPPRDWRAEAGVRTTKPLSERVLWFWVENLGVRDESFSDAYIDVPDGGVMHPFPSQGLNLPRPLRPGFP
jgi:hypothetical protein